MGEVESTTVKELVVIFFRVLILQSPIHYTNLYSICWSVARSTDNKPIMLRLKQIDKKINGWNLALLEHELYRMQSMGLPSSKVYNYGYRRGRKITGQDIIMYLDNAKQEILELFMLLMREEELEIPIGSALRLTNPHFM